MAEGKSGGRGRKGTGGKAAKGRPATPPEPVEDDDVLDGLPLYAGLTPNQVVAFNLARAREWRRWTQGQAAEALEPFLGVRWSTASVSQAERSVAGKVVRNFSADEIVAFARAFRLPVAWFFMPPPPWAAEGVPIKLDTPDAAEFGESMAELLDLVFGDDEGASILAMRLQAFMQEVGVSYPLTDAQNRIDSMVRTRVATVARTALSDIRRWQTSLRAIAGHLEELEWRAKGAVAQDLNVPESELGGVRPMGADDEEGAN